MILPGPLKDESHQEHVDAHKTIITKHDREKVLKTVL